MIETEIMYVEKGGRTKWVQTVWGRKWRQKKELWPNTKRQRVWRLWVLKSRCTVLYLVQTGIPICRILFLDSQSNVDIHLKKASYKHPRCRTDTLHCNAGKAIVRRVILKGTVYHPGVIETSCPYITFRRNTRWPMSVLWWPALSYTRLMERTIYLNLQARGSASLMLNMTFHMH